MNEGRRIVAKDVSALTAGGLNTRPSPSEITNDSIFSTFDNGEDEDNLNKKNGRNNNNSRSAMEDTRDDHLMQQQQQQQQEEDLADPQLPSVGLRRSRLGSRYDTQQQGEQRGDKYTAPNNNLTSPTGVDEFDTSNLNWSRKAASGRVNSHTTTSTTHGQIRRPSPTTTTDSNLTDDDSLQQRGHGSGGGVKKSRTATGGGGSIASKTEDDEEILDEDDEDTRASSMYDDDTRTYDDGTSCADETTLGETIDDTTLGESTWASYDEDDSYISNSESMGGKFSPGHKKGTKPAPILKSGLKNKNGNNKKSVKRSDSDTGGKRVTIHSHRGKGEVNDEDFTLFDDVNAMCPTIPSLAMIQEEVNGTYKDFTSALHQVSTSFVISPDDIDRMADKIRDAKIELGENYQKQMKDRQQVGGGGTGDGVVPQQQQRPAVKTEKKKMTGKTTTAKSSSSSSSSSQKRSQSKKKTLAAV